MGSETSPASGAYVGQLANHARKLQGEARDALERGEFTRASALIGDAELLAEDVHGMVGDMERRQLGDLSMLATYDIRALAAAAPLRLPPPPRRSLRLAIGATLAMSLALTEC